MNKVFTIFLLLLLMGCSPKTEYVEVFIPVRTPMDRPDRPVYIESDEPVTYLIEVINYVKKLENIIDTYNGSINE